MVVEYVLDWTTAHDWTWDPDAVQWLMEVLPTHLWQPSLPRLVVSACRAGSDASLQWIEQHFPLTWDDSRYQFEWKSTVHGPRPQHSQKYVEQCLHAATASGSFDVIWRIVRLGNWRWDFGDLVSIALEQGHVELAQELCKSTRGYNEDWWLGGRTAPCRRALDILCRRDDIALLDTFLAMFHFDPSHDTKRHTLINVLFETRRDVATLEWFEKRFRLSADDRAGLVACGWRQWDALRWLLTQRAPKPSWIIAVCSTGGKDEFEMLLGLIGDDKIPEFWKLMIEAAYQNPNPDVAKMLWSRPEAKTLSLEQNVQRHMLFDQCRIGGDTTLIGMVMPLALLLSRDTIGHAIGLAIAAARMDVARMLLRAAQMTDADLCDLELYMALEADKLVKLATEHGDQGLDMLRWIRPLFAATKRWTDVTRAFVLLCGRRDGWAGAELLAKQFQDKWDADKVGPDALAQAYLVDTSRVEAVHQMFAMDVKCCAAALPQLLWRNGVHHAQDLIRRFQIPRDVVCTTLSGWSVSSVGFEFDCFETYAWLRREYDFGCATDRER